MPLGKVFDAREGQVLFNPVSNYYQGKAIRADIGLREKQGEALQMEMDAAPAAAEAAQREQQRKEVDTLTKVNKENRLATAAEAKKQAQARFADTTTFQSLAESDGEEAASAWITEKWKAQAELLPDSPEKEQFMRYFEDNVITAQEVEEARNEFGTIIGEIDKAISSYEPTAKMKEAAALGYEPGSKEYERFMTRSERRGSVNDVIVPILTKMAAGKDITPDEQKVLDIYTRASLEEKLMIAAFGGDLSDLSNLSDDRDVDEGGDNTKSDAVPVNQVLSKDQVITSLIAEFANIPAGSERDEKLDRFLAIAKETTGVDLSKEEAQIIIDNWAGSNVYPNADRGSFRE